MRSIISKYPGECSKCFKPFSPGETIMYEKTTGVFCPGCEPIEVEDIRHFRTIKAERKAERLHSKANRLETTAAGKMAEFNHLRQDWAYITQPIIAGHSGSQRFGRQRDKVFNRYNKGLEMLSEADAAREKADNIMRYKTRVKGDAARHDALMREKMDAITEIGSRVYDYCYGWGTVKKKNKKTYTVQYDSGGLYPRDKIYFKPQAIEAS